MNEIRRFAVRHFAANLVDEYDVRLRLDELTPRVVHLHVESLELLGAPRDLLGVLGRLALQASAAGHGSHDFVVHGAHGHRARVGLDRPVHLVADPAVVVLECLELPLDLLHARAERLERAFGAVVMRQCGSNPAFVFGVLRVGI